MINKIYTYGCSFSYNFWIDENETYTNKIARYLNVEYKNNSFPAMCHNLIYEKLLIDSLEFNKNDLIIYQFTSGNREGYILDNNFYYTSAGIGKTVKETVDVFNAWGGGREKYPMTDNQIEILIDYINNWGDYTLDFKFRKVNHLMQLLEKKIGIKYVYLFLDNKFDRFESLNKINFPTPTNDKNYAIIEYVSENKLTLSDSNKGSDKNDKHPNETGHTHIADRIINYLENEIC